MVIWMGGGESGVDTRRLNFEPSMRLVLAGTIQFAASLQAAREQLAPCYASLRVPQSRPLSPGAQNQPF